MKKENQNNITELSDATLSTISGGGVDWRAIGVCLAAGPGLCAIAWGFYNGYEAAKRGN